MTSHDRRGLDHALDPAFLEELEGLDLSEVRSRRDLAREEEEILSFVRRWLHGKLDILRSELIRRRDREQGDIMSRLSAILSEGVSGSGRGARSGMPSERIQTLGHRAVEQLVSQDHLARLPDLDDAEIEEIIERLVSEERIVSDQRRQLHKVIDELSTELSKRYRTGSASVEDILGPSPKTGSGG